MSEKNNNEKNINEELNGQQLTEDALTEAASAEEEASAVPEAVTEAEAVQDVSGVQAADDEAVSEETAVTESESETGTESEASEENSEETESTDGEEVEKEEKEPFIKRLRKGLSAFWERCGMPDKLLPRLLGVYLIISGVNLIGVFYKGDEINPITFWKEYVDIIDITGTCLLVLGGFVLLTILHYVSPPKIRVLDTFAMFAGTVFFSGALMWRNNDYYLCIGVVLISVVFMCYLAGKTSNDRFEKLPDWLAGIIIFTAAAVVTGFVAATSIAHHKVFGTSCFDFGIFVQMFHYMSEYLTLDTTCERDTLMSHLCVHASFIYYLLLPVYKMFPGESTLLIAQAVLAMGGVVPLFLIAKNHRFKGFALVAMCLVYVFYSGFIGPCYYDFHENAFLPTLLMWLLYAVDKRKYVLFYIMAALTCMVKEDAPLYVVCISLYLLFSEKTWKAVHGAIVMVLSGTYFVLITNWLSVNGEGASMAASRFGNLTIEAEDGFAGIVMNVLTDPAYFVSLFVKESTLIFLIQVMLPLLFLPFMTKKIHRYLLMIPFIIMNLVIGSHYGYAAQIHYQYIFGPSCLLIYMMLLNCKDMSPEKRNMAVTGSMIASVLTSVCLFSGNIGYIESYKENEEQFVNMEECLDSIPQDASVICNAWWIPHIADRDEIYLLDNADLEIDENNQILLGVKEPYKYDFYVLCTTDPYIPEAALKLEAEGFIRYAQAAPNMLVYQNPLYTVE